MDQKNKVLDPVVYLEQQLNYLRYLAKCYSPVTPQKKEWHEAPKPVSKTPNWESSRNCDIKPKQNWPKNPYDEIPVKALSVPYEKIADKGPPSRVKRKSETKKSFLKRKSQKVIPNKATSPNILTPKSKLAAYLNPSLSDEELSGCEEKSPEEFIRFPPERTRESLVSKNASRSSDSASPSLRKQASTNTEEKLFSLDKPTPLKNRLKKSVVKTRLKAKTPKPVLKSSPRLNENETYAKLIKVVEAKMQKVENDSKKFRKIKETELLSLENWKSDERKKILKEKKSLKSIAKKIADQGIQKMRDEVQKLSCLISTNEEEHKNEVETLKGVIEELSHQNEILLKKINEISQEYYDSKSLQNLSGISEAPNTVPSLKFPKTMSPIPESPPSFTLKLPKPPTKPVKNKKNKRKPSEKHEKREIIFSNGVKKEIFPDGYVLVSFKNQDKKELFPDGKTVYHFFETDTVQTTFPDGLLVLEFPNGQIEKHFVDGSKEVKFADGTLKCIFYDGQEESMYPDGTLEKIDQNGVRIVEYPDGVKDTFLLDGRKVRVLLDGTVKKYLENEKIAE